MNLPDKPGPARDAAILAAIRAGEYDASFTPITSTVPGHSGTFHVFADALKIDGVRITMSAYLMQTVADMLDCVLPTTKLSDLLFDQRVITLPPHTQTPDATMVLTSVMEAQSSWIDQQLAGKSGLAGTLGKVWAISNLFQMNPSTKGKAINYGWHFPAGTSFQGKTWAKAATTDARVVQNPGWAHAPQEVDYSQNCILVSRHCEIDGVARDILDVFADATLAPLANGDGILHVTRQPGVPVVASIINGGGSSDPPSLATNNNGVLRISAGGGGSSDGGTSLAAIGVAALALGLWGGFQAFPKVRF